MNGVKKQPLDDLLQDWSQRHEPEQAQLEALRQRVAETLTTTGTVEPVTEQSVRHWRPPAWCAAATIAFAVAAAWWLYTQPRSGRGIAEPSVAAGGVSAGGPAIEHSLAELAAQERLLAETGRLFGDRLDWLAEEGRQVQVGLAEQTFGEREDSPAIAIRLVVVRRNEHETAWVPIRSIDVIARSEAAVQLPGDDNGLFLWAYVLPDGAIAVDTDLRVAGTAAFRASASGIFAPGVPAMLSSRHTNGTQYRVFQVASLLRSAAG